VLREHAAALGLLWPLDLISFIGAESSPLSVGFLHSLHPSCLAGGYGYLFLKILAAELIPDAEHLIVLDPDVLVLDDVAALWATFRSFGPHHLVSMAVDQSDRYYYRLQDPEDPVYSEGWRGVPHTVGVNGGVMLLHAGRARRWDFASHIASLTHTGAQLRDSGKLEGFCALAEQDTLNLAFARDPSIWFPLDCTWNYMATNRGGHLMATDGELPSVFYDTCPHGVTGSAGKPGDLLRCSCGRRVQLLHFVGGVRGSHLLRQLNESLLSLSGPQLRLLAQLRRGRPSLASAQRS